MGAHKGTYNPDSPLPLNHQGPVFRPYGSPPTDNGPPLFRRNLTSAWGCSQHILCPNQQGGQSYLTYRKQYLKFNDAASNTLLILTGMQQGSILGPLLFLIYVIDIHKSSNILEFLVNADNTILSSILNISKHQTIDILKQNSKKPPDLNLINYPLLQIKQK